MSVQPYEPIVAHVIAHAGLAAAEAQQALDAVAEALGEALTARERAAVADDLPPPLARAMRGAEPVGHGDPERMLERVGALEAVPAGFAREHAVVSCRAIVAALSPETRALLRRHLGDTWSELLEDSPADDAPPRPRHGRRSLAEGQPGSPHGLADTAPPAGQRDSVARTDNPHGDSKLSSGEPARPRPIGGGR